MGTKGNQNKRGMPRGERRGDEEEEEECEVAAGHQTAERSSEKL